MCGIQVIWLGLSILYMHNRLFLHSKSRSLLLLPSYGVTDYLREEFVHV